MSATIPETEPVQFAAGETVKWHRSLTDYASGDNWTLTYYFRGPDTFDVVGTPVANSRKWLLELAAATTAIFKSGTYSWVAKVDLLGEVFQVDSGRLTITKDLSQEPAGYEARSTARECVERIEAVMKKRASRDDLNYQAPGTGMSLSRMTPAQLATWYDYWLQKLHAEEDAEDAANGLPSKKHTRVVFRRP